MYIVTYKGPFGFIKPWTAVRDGETFSQQFLTPSIIEGLRQKLGVNKIMRHRLRYENISAQQETTQAKAYTEKKIKIEGQEGRKVTRNTSILTRGVMINPALILAFESKQDAEKASVQSICLCRNEDILLPDSAIREMSESDFDKLDGFELLFREDEESFLVGFNRFENSTPMYGKLIIQGTPVKSWD